MGLKAGPSLMGQTWTACILQQSGGENIWT